MYYPDFRQQQAFDPSRFGDPVALQTSWHHGRLSGANFCTSKLVAAGPDKVKFSATIGAIMFDLIFLIAGIGVLVLTKFSVLVPTLLGLVFAILGGYLLIFTHKTFTFDKADGTFYKGNKKPGQDTLERLDRIHAIQLLSCYVTGKNSYYCFELNLVLDNGERVEVICHGNRRRIIRDAESLSLFLNRPIWDAI